MRITTALLWRFSTFLKKRILLQNHFPPDDLESQIEAFVEHYNHQCYHESLNKVMPSDA